VVWTQQYPFMPWKNEVAECKQDVF